MSDHHDVGTISSLEELFLSREFGHSEEIDSPTWLDELWLARTSYDPEPHFETGPLEEVFLSRDFGQPLADDDEEGAIDLEGPGATVLAFTPRDASARQRAVAAISGVAAAMLVVAGVASGSGHPNSPGAPKVQAQAAAPAGQGSGTAPASAAPSPSSSSTPASAANELGSQPAVLTSATAPAPQVAVAAPAGIHRHRRPDDPGHRDRRSTGPGPGPGPRRRRRRARSPQRRRRGRRQYRGDGRYDRDVPRPARSVPPSRRCRRSPAFSAASEPLFRASGRCSRRPRPESTRPRRGIDAYSLLLHSVF